MTLDKLSTMILTSPDRAITYLAINGCTQVADRVNRSVEDREYWAEFFLQGKTCIDFRHTLTSIAGPWYEACALIKRMEEEA